MKKDNAEKLVKFFNAPLEDLADIFHYNEENKVILRGDETTFYAKYPKTVAYLTSRDSKFRMDKRTPFEFCYDLVMNWLMEDYIAFKLSTIGFRTNYGSHDRNREIISTKVTTDPDLMMYIDNQWVPIEVQSDYSGWVSSGKSLAIKEGKYNTILRKKAMLLQICVNNKSFCLIPTDRLLKPSRRAPNPRMGDKMMVYFDNLNLVFSPFDNSNVNNGTHTYIPTASTAEKVTERLTPLPPKYRKKDTIVVNTNMVKNELFN